MAGWLFRSPVRVKAAGKPSLLDQGVSTNLSLSGSCEGCLLCLLVVSNKRRAPSQEITWCNDMCVAPWKEYQRIHSGWVFWWCSWASVDSARSYKSQLEPKVATEKHFRETQHSWLCCSLLQTWWPTSALLSHNKEGQNDPKKAHQKATNRPHLLLRRFTFSLKKIIWRVFILSSILRPFFCSCG